jgi:hypothetical protein
MKTTKLLITVLGILLMFGSLANAAVVDVVQYSTGFFVPDQTQVYNAPYYRWYNQDWGWTHGAIGGNITTATLNIGAWDVDAAQGEVDNIYAYDNGVRTLLGTLAGGDNIWGYSTFNLDSSFFDDIATGLQIDMDIDTTHTENWWAVTLSKSALSIDNGILPDPNPGRVVPEPATMSLFGLGLLGLVGKLRKKNS